MSLDGLKDTHDWIRKPGSFETTLNSFKLFENSSITSVVMTTVSKSNLDEIPELVDIIVKNNINMFGFARYCPTYSDFNLIPSPEEYRDFLDKMWKKFEQYKDGPTDFKLKDHLWKLYLYEKGLFNPSNIENPDDLILDGCHCGICHLTVLADGTVYACRRCESPIGKVPEQEFSDIFLGEALDEYRKFDHFEKCKDCELKNFCLIFLT